MTRCRDCPLFEKITVAERAKYRAGGRCTSPIFGRLTGAYVSGNCPEDTVPCRLHTKAF